MLAFGVGLLAVAAFVHRRHWLAVVLTVAAAAVHNTTGLWFAVLIGAAIVVLEPAWRRVGVPAAVVGVAVAAWALLAGPLRGRLVVMDEPVAAGRGVEGFALRQRVAAVGLGDQPGHAGRAVGGAPVARRAQAAPAPKNAALAWGATALVALFLVTLPAVAARVAFPVQLQISRVFWLVDFVATVCLVGAIADWPRLVRLGRPALALCLAALAAGRGAYILFVEHPERPLFRPGCRPRPGTRRCDGWRAQPQDATCSPIRATRGATARACA